MRKVPFRKSVSQTVTAEIIKAKNAMTVAIIGALTLSNRYESRIGIAAARKVQREIPELFFPFDVLAYQSLDGEESAE
jgi:hypothetical protein